MARIKYGVAQAGRTFCGVILLLCLLHGVARAPAIAEPVFPVLLGRVVDGAALLSPPAQARLSGWLEDFRARFRQTGRRGDGAGSAGLSD